MAICYHGSGTIVPNKKGITAAPIRYGDTVFGKFKKLCEEYDEGTDFETKDNGSFNFINYVRWKFLYDIKELLEAEKDKIEFARIMFFCHDEDGSVEKPFPFCVMYEVADGEVFESTIETRLPEGFWACRVQ